MDEEAGWLRWSREHPWLFAAVGGAIIGIVIGLIAADEENSLAVGIVAGMLFAIPLFIVGGVWGALQKRRAESKATSESRLRTWRRVHPVLWPIAMAVAGFLTVFLIEWVRGRPASQALVLAVGVSVIVTVIALLNRGAKSAR